MSISFQKIVLAISIVLGVGYRFYCLTTIYHQSNNIIQVDDSVSYLIHGAVILNDPGYNSPLMKSFDSLEFINPSHNWYEWTQNRHHTRLKSFYHRGHAFIVAALHSWFGLHYKDVWWILTYVLNFLLILGIGILGAYLFGEKVASVAVILYSPMALNISHQFTAAPREWSALALIYSLIFLGKALESKKYDYGFWGWTLSLWFSIAFCFSFHTMGLLFLGIIILLLFALYFTTQGYTARRNIPLLSVSLLIAALFLPKVVTEYLGVLDSTGLGAELVFKKWGFGNLQSYWKLTLDEIADNFFGSRIDSESTIFLVLASSFILGLVASFLYVIRSLYLERDELKKFRLLYSLLTILLFILFSISLEFAGLPYGPIHNYLFVGTYAVTLKMFSFSLLISVLTCLLLNRISSQRKRLLVILSLFLMVLLIHEEKFILQTKKFASDQIEDPYELIQHININRDKKDECLTIIGEVALYYYVLYGDYSQKIFYKDGCNKARYTNHGYFKSERYRKMGVVEYESNNCKSVFGIFNKYNMEQCSEWKRKVAREDSHGCEISLNIGEFSYFQHNGECLAMRTL